MPLVPPKESSQAIVRSRGGLTTKIHALVEGLVKLARFILAEGRHVATRCDKLAQSLAFFIALVAVFVWLT